VVAADLDEELDVLVNQVHRVDRHQGHLVLLLLLKLGETFLQTRIHRHLW
jgi:hypothetical protein